MRYLFTVVALTLASFVSFPAQSLREAAKKLGGAADNTFNAEFQQRSLVSRDELVGAAPRSFRLERGTLGFDRVVKPMLAQQLIQATIEWMACACRQLGGRHPHRRLPRACTFTHGHARSLVRRPDRVDV